ncbi:arylsulfatase A-like enzyme [Phenylobacterium haematophilum]|uniref:Arylsulfatase A-like enzyme n=1 Tax=Phenylobacterium haematophilum TaxID=98513 RepID=A0A840A3E1_9CAUL|nr:sulfatase-like hydrolase/transferase [Phenylobacterium haematophilum]MBB3892193.1 arylsulfatase A-like enzyme [Phenylobacterium haematophilum]
MKRRWKWLGASVLVLAAGAGLAAANRTTILSMIARAQMPPVEDNRAVNWAQGPQTPAEGERPPNVVFILADDLGYNDITINGGGVANGAVPTPNIDAIGKEGVVFAAGYAGNATCAPSRAAIMTGRYPTRFGFEFTPAPVAFARMVGTEAEPGAIVKPKFFPDRIKDMPPGSTARNPAAVNELSMPSSEITIAEVLKAKGYHTVHLGKWHLGGKKGSRPEDQGFDESLGFIAGGSMFLPAKDPNVVNSKQDWDAIDRFLWPNLPYAVQFNGSSLFKPKGYMTDYLTDEAVKAIKANRNRPFFLYYAPNAIHTPLQATKADYDALPQIKDHRTRVYGAMARNLDANIGRILQALKDEGLDENTLVIFSSDNGGAGYVGLPDVNKPYRGFKSTFFEGGVRTPFFMRWPGVIQPGSTYGYPVGHIDIFATAAAAGGAGLPTDRPIDGVDLLPHVQGKNPARPHQTLFWRSGQYKAVLDGDWKLQVNGARDKVWLYDLASDPTEQRDQSAAQPERVKALKELIARQDAQSVKPIWPSLLQGPVFIDKPGGVPQKAGDEYILWDN